MKGKLTMQISITLTSNNMKQNAQELTHLASLLAAATSDDVGTTTQGGGEEKSHIHVGELKNGSPTASARTRRTKKEMAAAAATATPTDDDGLDFGGDDLTSETGDEATADEEEEVTYTLEGDIIPAFQAYAKKHSREKAGKVLAKFKVKSVRDLPEAKFPEVLAALSN